MKSDVIDYIDFEESNSGSMTQFPEIISAAMKLMDMYLFHK